MEEDLRAGWLRKLLQKIFDFISYATGVGKTADYFGFVVSDRELIQRSHSSGNEEHDVARPYEHYIAPFQAKARVDQHIASINWEFVALDVFELIACGRNPNMKSSVIVCLFADLINDAGGRPGQQNDVTRRDGARQ